MSMFGLKLMSELRSARELIAHAEMAAETGLEFVSISDHFHPWLPEHEHSPFTWSVLGAVAQQVPTIELATGVTCPMFRYHPAIVAQAAATVATVTERPFTLAVGAGERLNEHITGSTFPPVGVRHERLEEAITIIRRLWEGGWTTFHGHHLTVEDARLFDLPVHPINLVVAVSGDESLDLAERVGADGIVANGSDPSLTEGWSARQGDGSMTWTEIPFSWAPSLDEGRAQALERFRFGALGWKVMSELPNPVNFDAASQFVRADDLGSSVPSGPDPEPYIDAVRTAQQAGYERISIVPVGDDVQGLLKFWTDEVEPELV